MTTVTPGSCPYCGSYWHSGMCPRIESIEYHRDGSIKKVTLRDVVTQSEMNIEVTFGNPLLGVPVMPAPPFRIDCENARG